MRATTSALPVPQAWCAALVLSAVEVLLGLRGPAQLARWLTLGLRTTLARQARASQSLPVDARRARVLRVHLYEVDQSHHEQRSDP